MLKSCSPPILSWLEVWTDVLLQDKDIVELNPVPFWLHVWEHRLAGKLIISRAAGAESISFSSCFIQPRYHVARINSAFLFHNILLSVTHQALELPGCCLRCNHWKSLDYTHTSSPFTFFCTLENQMTAAAIPFQYILTLKSLFSCSVAKIRPQGWKSDISQTLLLRSGKCAPHNTCSSCTGGL